MDITPYLYIPFFTWVVAQAIKFFLALIRGDVDLRYLYASGGMPSVHSAVVVSLATTALIYGGPANPLFGFAAVFAAIVMYDSFGVRRSAGEQAKAINKLVADLSNAGGLKNADDYSEMREILGHKPLEVIIGALLGFVIACIFSWQKIAPYLSVFDYDLTAMQAKAIMIGLAGFVAITLVLFFVIRALIKNKEARKYNFYLLGVNILAAVFALGLAFLYYEGLKYPNGLLGFVFIVVVWAIAAIFCIYYIYKSAKSGKKSNHEIKKDAWLKRAGKKK